MFFSFFFIYFTYSILLKILFFSALYNKTYTTFKLSNTSFSLLESSFTSFLSLTYYTKLYNNLLGCLSVYKLRLKFRS